MYHRIIPKEPVFGKFRLVVGNKETPFPPIRIKVIVENFWKNMGYSLYFNRTFAYETYYYGIYSMRYTSTALYFYEENIQAPNNFF
jgi:hypothetical protein